MYNIKQYDKICIFTSFGLVIGGIRLFLNIPIYQGTYVLISLILCFIASCFFRFSRLYNLKNVEKYMMIDIITALHAYFVCSIILYPFMKTIFFVGLIVSFIIFIIATKINYNMSLYLHTLGHIVLITTLILL